MKKLLIEILSEEIPSCYQIDAMNKIASTLSKELGNAFDMHTAVEKFVTPCRLVFVAKIDPSKVSLGSELSQKKVRGPKITAPEAAIIGFMKRHGIEEVSKMEVESDYYFYTSETSLQDHLSLLTDIVYNAINSFTWPKSMRWGEYSMEWIRPVHSVIVMLDDEVLPVRIGHIQSGRSTVGHKFIAPSELHVKNVDDYFSQLSNAYVMVSHEERRKIIVSAIEEFAKEKNLVTIEDESLLQEVVGMVEYPVVLFGEIEEEFLSLPKEVLITTLKKNQKYFLMMERDGSISRNFAIVSNINTDNGKQIIFGNEKVAKARLSDAAFFFKKDQDIRFSERTELLKTFSFHIKVGTMYDKMQRVEKIACRIMDIMDGEKDVGGEINLDIVKRAIWLMKNDLTTEMVQEFPDLQGVAGYYYAIGSGESTDVAVAIRDHYRPQGPSDRLPESKLAAVVSIADKLDTIASMFGAGILPTGSKDPYALRRMAIGILRMIHHYKIVVSIEVLSGGDVRQFIEHKLHNLHLLEDDDGLRCIEKSLLCE